MNLSLGVVGGSLQSLRDTYKLIKTIQNVFSKNMLKPINSKTSKIQNRIFKTTSKGLGNVSPLCQILRVWLSLDLLLQQHWLHLFLSSCCLDCWDSHSCSDPYDTDSILLWTFQLSSLVLSISFLYDEKHKHLILIWDWQPQIPLILLDYMHPIILQRWELLNQCS